MKKHLSLICAAVALVVAVTSCKKDPKVDGAGQIGFQQTSLSADGAGDEVTLNIISKGGWYLEFSNPDTGENVRWINADKKEGNGNSEVKLIVARNPSASPRTANVNVMTADWLDMATITLTQSGGSGGSNEGYSFPVCEIFEIDANNNFSNGYFDGNVCIFDNGMTITRTGAGASLAFVCPCHVNPVVDPWFQRGMTAANWTAEDSSPTAVKLKDELSGSLRYMFGSRRDNSGAWNLSWSGDGENWTDFTSGVVGGGANGGADAMWKSADFTIPQSKKIAAGGTLTIRMTPVDHTKLGTATHPNALFQHGVCITVADAAKTALPAADNSTVVFSHGFDEITGVRGAQVDLPIGFMTSWHAGPYIVPSALTEMAAVVNSYNRPGFLQVGNGDEALITKYTQGSYKITIGERFEQMNIIKSDLKLTFLASAMVDAYGRPTDPGVVVKVEGGGATVDNNGVVTGVENNSFKSFDLFIRNATSDTKITITSAPMAESTDDVRFFIDDVILRVEGEPERPSAEDPVRSDIQAIRDKKGTSAVTIPDNLFIQGRVIATDNVPAGCFVPADDGAGIFVKMAGHGLAAGETAKVVVKNAQLAVDADGLLTLTPTAADKVSKIAGEAQMPAAKAITVAELKAGTYEAMYVSLPESQVAAADLGKTMNGNITLELEDAATNFTMKTYSNASFASANVPQKSGVPSGVAGTTQLLPASTADLSAMTGTRFGEAVYAITPISGYLLSLKSGTNLSWRNISYADKTVTFSSPEGCTITKVGGTASDECSLMRGYNDASTNMYDVRFMTTGWGGENWQDNGLVFKIKATSRLVGNLRFGFGFMGDGRAPKNFKVVWSNDNSTWSATKILSTPGYNDPQDSFALNTANSIYYRMATFNVPESQAVAEGGFIYVKIMQADNECYTNGLTVDPVGGKANFINGFYLTTHEKRAYHTSTLPSGANVLLSEGFDDAFLGHGNFIPSWQFMTSYNSVYTMPEGWTSTGGIYQMPGYIRCGASGTVTSSVTTPALTALGDTPTDITVKFKAAVLLVAAANYTPDNKLMTVSASVGTVTAQPASLPNWSSLPGTVSGDLTEQVATSMETAYHKWQDIEIRVTGATRDTKITISHTGRHFIDDIVITRD